MFLALLNPCFSNRYSMLAFVQCILIETETNGFSAYLTFHFQPWCDETIHRKMERNHKKKTKPLLITQEFHICFFFCFDIFSTPMNVTVMKLWGLRHVWFHLVCWPAAERSVGTTEVIRKECALVMFNFWYRVLYKYLRLASFHFLRNKAMVWLY